MNLFVKKEIISVNVYAFENDDLSLSAVDSENAVPKDKQVKKLTFQFKRPNWKDSNTIMGKAHKIVQEQFVVDSTAMQEEALRGLLVDWDLTDENNEKVEFSQARLSELDPVIARAAFSGLLNKVSL